MEHHDLYQSLFGETLKPKHHHMVHYPMVMKMVGPLKNIWSMRFEAKHRLSKLAANVTSTRVNISTTLAIKHQLKLCYRFTNKIGFSKSLLLVQTVFLTVYMILYLSSMILFLHVFKNINTFCQTCLMLRKSLFVELYTK